MSKSYNRGGQQRTIQAPCGFSCKGQLREANAKFATHNRLCKSCKEIKEGTNPVIIPPAFSKEGGKVNGWNGIKNLTTGKTTKVMTTTLVNGRRDDILVDASSIEEAIKGDKLQEELRRRYGIFADNQEYDSDEEDEHQLLLDELISLIHFGGSLGVTVAAAKYSGCELEVMEDRKLQIIINLTKRQLQLE